MCRGVWGGGEGMRGGFVGGMRRLGGSLLCLFGEGLVVAWSRELWGLYFGFGIGAGD